MIVLTHLAVGVVTGFLAGVPLEIAKHYINSIWEDDKEISDLHKELVEEFNHLESKKSLRVGDRFHSRCPPDWLDELEKCNYDYEDIQECMNPKVRKKIVVDYLKTYLKYVKLTSTEMTNGPREDSNPQDYDCSVYNLLSSREECKSEIIENLISKNTNRFGVSIIGMGGIGKTVLARAIEDQTSKGHFHVISTPKSPNFNLKAAIACIESNKPPSKDERVLILLDGLHRVKPEDWYKFRSKCQVILHPESKVLITTQNSRVADVTGTSKYCVPPLLGDECFSFICKLVGNLEDDGDKIAIKANKGELVDSCRGLPLLANQIGMLLLGVGDGNRKSSIREITTQNLWEVEGLKRVLLNLELVSLLEQKPALIRCLAFCSLFPIDYEFEQDDLLQFWMDGGFTLASTNATWMEDTTKEYFDDLHSCSLFQTSASLPAQQPRYKLSRLFYDMALNVASKTFCHNHITKFTRHVSLSCEKTENSGDIDMDGLLSDLVSSCTSLRTFLFVNKSGEKVKDPTFFKKLTRLRVLDLRHTCIRKLEKKHISGLKFLRYLDLSHSQVERLPTLSNSSKLRVLKLHHCAHLEDLNKDLTQLTNLTSLEVNHNSLKSLPSNIGKLINLRRLDTFVVGKSEGFKIAELRNLNSLRKSLVIKKLENVESKEEAVKAMLSSKIWLDKLELKWSSLEQNGTAEQVLEGLQPPKNLTELKISNYSGTNFPQWFNEAEVCGALKSIHLNSCRALPSVDKLQLKTLRIEAMQNIHRESSTGFINVETLVLYNMSRVDWCIELAVGRMPCLQNLRVDKCEKLKQLPSLENLTSLKKLELIGCTEMRELPALPRSLVRLIIKDSNTLEERCQSGGADLHKIRGIAVEINSPLSEPDSTAAGQPSSSSQVVTDSTPVNTSKPDSTAAGQPSSSIQILTDSTPVNTSVSDATAACQPSSSSQVVTDPTAASHPSTRIEEANGHQTTSPNLRRAPVNTSEPDSTAAGQQSSRSQVATDSSTGIETPKGHKITSPDLRRVECKVSEGGSEPASTIEGHLATGHPSTKVEAANEHQTTSSNLRRALVNTSEPDSTAAGQQSSRSQVATNSKPAELIEPNPTAASHSSTGIEHTPNGHQIHSPDLQHAECKVSEGGSEPASTIEGHLATGHPSTKVEATNEHQTTSPNLRRGPDSTTGSNPSSSNDNVNDSTTADTSGPETTEMDHPSKQVEDSSLANQYIAHQSNHGEEKSASLRSRLFGRLRCFLCYA